MISFTYDVIRAFDLAQKNSKQVSGEAVNLGGGRGNVASLLETIAHIETLTNKKLHLSFEDWRPGDNKCYYTDYSKAKKLLGWKPEVNWKEGIHRTLDWVQTNTQQISSVMS